MTSIRDKIFMSWLWYGVAILVAVSIPNQFGLLLAIPISWLGAASRRGIPNERMSPFERAKKIWPRWPIFAALWYVPVSALMLVDAFHGGLFFYSLSSRMALLLGLLVMFLPVLVLAVLTDLSRIKSAKGAP